MDSGPIQEINSWLDNNGTFQEGVSLYLKHGKNKGVMRSLQRCNPSPRSRARLEHQLKKLLPVLDKPKVQPKKKVKPQVTHEPKQVLSRIPDMDPNDVVAYSTSMHTPVDPMMLPTELRKDWFDMVGLQHQSRNLHWSLQTKTDKEDVRSTAEIILKQKERIAQIFARVDHFVKTGEIISSKAPEIDPSKLSDIEIVKTYNYRKTSVSKYQEKVKSLTKDLNKCSDMKQRQKLEAKLNRAQDKLEQHRADRDALKLAIENKQSSS